MRWIKDSHRFLTPPSLRDEVYLFSFRIWVSSVTAFMARIPWKRCCASFQAWALSNAQRLLSISWNIHSGGSCHFWKKSIQRPPGCEEAQESHMERARRILSCSGQTSVGTKHAIKGAILEIPGLAEVTWRKTEEASQKPALCGPNWAILAIFSYLNWNPTPLWSREEPFLMRTAQILDPQNYNTMLF